MSFLLIRGWRARVLLAVAGGMAAAFLLSWLSPTSYVARSHVTTTDRAQIGRAHAFATGPAFSANLAGSLGASPEELDRALTIEINALGGWLSFESRHQSATAAARVANLAATTLAAEAPGGAQVLVTANPPTAPVTKTPQGLALMGGALALLTASTFELAVGALRRVVHHPHHGAWPAGSPWHRRRPSGADRALLRSPLVPLPISPEPADILVASADHSHADVLGILIVERLRAEGRPVERARTAPSVPSRAQLHIAGQRRKDTDTVWALPTLDPAAVSAWAAASDCVLVAVVIGETSDRALRQTVEAVEREGRSVDAVLALERRRSRPTVHPEECEWAVMD
jgi:hypothetical protein